MELTIIRHGPLDIQVCVPSGWSDQQVMDRTNSNQCSGTKQGYVIRRQGDPALGDDPERQPCDDHDGFVHIVLDA